MTAQISTPATDHISTVRSLLTQLRWHDGPGHTHYESIKDTITARVWKEVDVFVIESFTPSTAAEGQVSAAVDRLLNPASRPANSTSVSLVILPGQGRFLIVALDLPRGGGAIPEDAVSFRAYKDDGNRFTFIAEINDVRSDDSSAPFLTGLSAKLIAYPPVAGECWFFAAAEIPPHAPPRVAIRLYAFNGSAFRTIWAPQDVVAESPERAIELIRNGFIVNRLVDPTGKAPGSPTVVRHEQYALTVNGPSKITDWQTDRQ